jgi:phospholipid/cholesterol/gamma-HCH transport system substrate-binding protein
VSVRGQLIRLTVFAVLAVGLLWVLWSTLLNSTGAATRSYVAEFTDVSGLHEGDNVRIAGVRVGRVESLELVGTRADVTIAVRADQPVFASTRAVIRYQNLVGQRYVALQPAPGPTRPLADGERIPIERTEPSLDLSALLNGFAPLFSVLRPAEVNQLSDNLVAVLQGSRPEIDPLLAETTRLTNAIADRDHVLGEVMGNLNRVLDQVAGKGPQTDELLAQGRRLVDGLNARTQPIFGSLERIRAFTGNGQELLADVRPDLRDDVRSAVGATDTLVREKGPLTDTLRGAPGLLAAGARVSQYGSWISLYACSAQLDARPLPRGTLDTERGLTQHSAVCR